MNHKSKFRNKSILLRIVHNMAYDNLVPAIYIIGMYSRHISIGYKKCVTHSPTLGETIRTTSGIYVESVHLDWFIRCLCTGKHLQSDLDIFRFDFMFVKPPNVPPLFCSNDQTDMIFWLQQLLFCATPILSVQELLCHKHTIEPEYV